MKIQYFILLKEAVTLQRMIQAENLMCACSRGGGGCIQMNSDFIELMEDRWKREEETARELIQQIKCLFFHRESLDGFGPQS